MMTTTALTTPTITTN